MGSKKELTGKHVPWIAAAAVIIAAVITAWATIHAQTMKLREEQRQRAKAQKEVQQYRKMFADAPEEFTRELGRQIDEAPSLVEPNVESPGNQNIIIEDAQAIVKSRNDLRSSLEDIGSHLDSQIDQLEQELKKPNPDPVKMDQILAVLRKSWPAKQKEIALRVRKMMDELGIERVVTDDTGQ